MSTCKRAPEVRADIEELFGAPIVVYTDEEAVADGVLVPITADGDVNRITRAVFDRFAKPIGDPRACVFDVTPLMDVIRALLAVEPDRGWRTGTYHGWELWLIPNEVGGLTLMFPEDY
jgi:hypothetical protein